MSEAPKVILLTIVFKSEYSTETTNRLNVSVTPDTAEQIASDWRDGEDEKGWYESTDEYGHTTPLLLRFDDILYIR